MLKSLIKNLVHWALRVKVEKNSDSHESEVRCPINGMTLDEYRAGGKPARWE